MAAAKKKLAKSKPQGGAGDAPSVNSQARKPHELHIWQIQAFRDVLLVAAGVGIIWLGYALSTVTVPLLVALLLAYLFEPLIQKISESEKINRPTAVGGLLCTGGLAVVLFLVLVIPLVVGQTIGFVNDYRSGAIRSQVAGIIEHTPEFVRSDIEGILDMFPTGEREPAGEETTQDDAGDSDAEPEPPSEDVPASGGPGGEVDEDRVRAIVGEELRRLDFGAQSDEQSSFFGIAGSGARTLWGVISGSIYVALIFFLVPFYFFFFSVYWPDVVQFGRTLIPEKNKDRAIELIVKMDQVVSGFVRGRIIICLITGVMLAVGWFSVGVPYAIVLGLVTGLLFLVPFLGSLGFLLALILNVVAVAGDPSRGSMWFLWAALWPTVVYVVVQFIESYILTPKIAGKATNLDPVTIVVAVLAGGTLLGVYGMLLAIPIAACAKILLVDVLFPKISEWLRGERSDPLPIERGD